MARQIAFVSLFFTVYTKNGQIAQLQAAAGPGIILVVISYVPKWVICFLSALGKERAEAGQLGKRGSLFIDVMVRKQFHGNPLELGITRSILRAQYFVLVLL